MSYSLSLTIPYNSYQQTSPDAINSVMRSVAVSATLPNIGEIAEFLDTGEACKSPVCKFKVLYCVPIS
jgi:replicative superfamily II helicase